jgi:hypothetical protein
MAHRVADRFGGEIVVEADAHPASTVKLRRTV